MSMMLIDQTKDSACKTAEADAIRAKTGGSAQLAYDWANNKGFADAITAIPTGATPTGTKQISINANGTTTEDVSAYADAEITVNVPSAGDYVATDWLVASKPTGVLTDTASGTRPSFQYALYNRTGITGLNFPNATRAQKNGVRDCTNITTINSPNINTILESAYRGVGIVTGVFPKVYDIGNYGIVSTAMTALDILGSNAGANGISNYGLYGNTSLSIIILRSTSGVMTLMHATNSLNNTPFKSGGTGGTLYVPESMISAYQAASNWSTVLGRATNQIKSIESTHTDPNAPIDLTMYYVDGTPLPTT